MREVLFQNYFPRLARARASKKLFLQAGTESLGTVPSGSLVPAGLQSVEEVGGPAHWRE